MPWLKHTSELLSPLLKPHNSGSQGPLVRFPWRLSIHLLLCTSVNISGHRSLLDSYCFSSSFLPSTHLLGLKVYTTMHGLILFLMAGAFSVASFLFIPKFKFRGHFSGKPSLMHLSPYYKQVGLGAPLCFYGSPSTCMCLNSPPGECLSDKMVRPGEKLVPVSSVPGKGLCRPRNMCCLGEGRLLHGYIYCPTDLFSQQLKMVLKQRVETPRGIAYHISCR